MASRKRSMSHDADIHALYKEWDEASCPICMDHPHNAVLLLCSSYDKGCRSYICDTSYRHSNCLDRFRKLKDENSDNNSSPSLNFINQLNMDNTTNGNIGLGTSGGQTEVEGDDVRIIDHVATEELPSGLGEGSTHAAHDHFGVRDETREADNSPSLSEMVDHEENNTENLSESMSKLRCPLCRGSILGLKVVDEGRSYLNLKARSCSRESCLFTGNYRELRRHARRIHPAARPADIEPSRERAWRRLENQREYDDIVSAIRSAMPGAVVLGDYAIENGDRLSGERERGPGENSRWLSTLFLFQMIGSMEPVAELRGGRSRALSRHRRSTGAFPRRRFLWGENLLGLRDDDGEDDDGEDETNINVLSDVGEDISPNRRRRRRLMHSRADNDQQ